jgi:hypothetical protein
LLAPCVRPSSEPTLSITSAWKRAEGDVRVGVLGRELIVVSSAFLTFVPSPCDSALAMLMPWL